MTGGNDEAIRLTAALWAERDWSHSMTTADRKALDTWLAADKRHIVEFELAVRLMGSGELTGALASAARDYAIRPTRARARRLWLQPIWVGMGMFAASAVAVFTAMTIIPAWVAPERAPLQLPATMALTTPAGQGRAELLPDGSRIDLNGGSVLTPAFTSTRRAIELASGDAAFQVAPDASRPFVVSTEHLSATALGTAFSVSRFDGHSSVRVTEHEVSVASRTLPAKVVIARPGDVVDIDAAGAVTVTHEDDASADWREGWIDTQAMTLSDLAATIHRRTGRPIKVAPSVQGLTVSGRFRIDEPDAVLRRLEMLHGLAVTKAGDGFALAAGAPD